MRSTVTKTGILLGLLLSLAPISPSTAANLQPTRYGLELHSPTRALIYIDGKFFGQVSPKAPLRMVLSQSKIQLRATEAGFLDVVDDLTLTAGKLVKLKLHMPPLRSKWKLPGGDIILQVGQVTRGRLKKGEVVRFRIPEKRLPHRMILGYSAMAQFKLIGPKGEIVPIKKRERPAGTPGKWFFEYKGANRGDYILEVRSQKGHYAFELGTGLPKLVETENKAMKGRRLAPTGPR